MKNACFASTMRKIDELAMSEAGIPSIVLMENAAISIVDVLKRDFSPLSDKRIAIFCGKGNNGGDGFAIARHLINLGVKVQVYLVCGDKFLGDAQVNYNILKNMNAKINKIDGKDDIPNVLWAYDVIVDAVFGTGISGEISGLLYDIINEINKYSRYTLSVDIPSGIQADTGEVCGICVKADKTITFASYKVGMFLFPAADYTGKIEIRDISIPKYILDKQNDGISVVDDNWAKSVFPKRKLDSHKGDYGKVFIIAGSVGLTGAAYLSAQSALYCGSGLVTLGIPKSLNSIMEEKLTEVMTIPLEDECGKLSILSIDKIIDKMNKCDAILFGPGLGISNDIVIILEKILENANVPVIIDADGINVLSKNMDMINNCSCDIVLTPHIVEFSRISGFKVEEIEKSRLQVSKSFSEEYGLTLILKGHHTIVTACDGLQYINNTGNSGMASGGSGDVLAGILASFIARGMNIDEAAVLSVYLHGLAGDITANRLGENSVIATEIIKSIPLAIEKVVLK